MSRSPEELLRQRKNVLKFDSVCDRVEQLHAQNFDDVVIDLEKVNILPDGNEKHPSVLLDVPNVGRLTMTDWSKKQLGSILGIKWDKWFNGDHVKAEEIQEELHRRFSRTHESRKIRARKFAPGSSAAKTADGFCRAILSPTYASIDDVRIFSRLAKRFRGQVSELGFIQNHLGTDFYNDRSSHYTIVSEPMSLGPIDRNHPDRRVRDIYDLADREGQLPEEDWVYNGMHFRNSEVGYTAVIMDSNTFRLACLNGAVVTVKGGRLLYRVHRSLDDDAIDGLLDNAFRKMPAAWEKNRKQMITLRDQTLNDPEAEILKFLTAQKATKSFIESVKEAYEVEPLPNRYGIMQAISKAAQAEEDMEKRAVYEELAGHYMQA